jgi:hypothetical protein
MNVKPPKFRHLESPAARSRTQHLGEFAELLIQSRLDHLILLGKRLSFSPLFHGDENKCVVARPDGAEQTETDNARGIFNARCLREYVFDVTCNLRRPLQRSGIRQLDVQIEVTLVFIRKEADRQSAADK